ncbi:hypothetical protein LUZ60_012057 [Juncus effusus]|nr:hypothetical protein LUZ60_012057 [Juncus effusus]
MNNDFVSFESFDFSFCSNLLKHTHNRTCLSTTQYSLIIFVLNPLKSDIYESTPLSFNVQTFSQSFSDIAMIGFGAFSLGFLLGFVGLIALEIVAILHIIRRLGRKKESTEVLEKKERRDLAGDPIPFSVDKKGFIWVLDPEKIPKISTDGVSTSEGSAKDLTAKKNIVEVVPVKKFAKIEDDSLIITEQDGSKSTIELVNCKALAVSSSDLPSKKWDKRYPIKLESNGNEFYNGTKTIYIYAETSWEKESWCKALNLAINKEKQTIFSEINKEFHYYLSSLNSNYPSFLKPSILLTESSLDKQNNKNVGPTKVGILLKKLAKKASNKTGIESSRTSSGEINEVRNNYEKLEGLDEKIGDDEGTLCLNLLLSRLFFDAKRSEAISSFINDRIKRTLSNARIPTYIKQIMCTSINLGSVPPFITKSRVLPMNLDELCALELEFEYSGGIKLNFETRLEIQEAELQKEILEGQNGNLEAGSELMEGMEQYRNDLKGVEREVGDNNTKEEEDELKQQTSWASSYITRWKNLVHSISDQVSQVPLSLEMKINSARGTLRLYIKPPPSDQIWFGFQSMPELDWNIETSIGEHKITNSHVGSLISNRFKVAIRENMVLPNCESISMPFMLGDKNDWVERNIVPFIWIDRVSNGLNSKPTINTSQIEEPNLNAENTNKTEETNKERNIMLRASEDLKQPLLANEKSQEIVKEGEMVMMVKEEDGNKQKRAGTRAKMMDFGKKFGDKLEEKRRLMEEKSRHIVEKMRENAKA